MQEGVSGQLIGHGRSQGYANLKLRLNLIIHNMELRVELRVAADGVYVRR